MYAFHPHGIWSPGWIVTCVWNKTFHKYAGFCNYAVDHVLRDKGLLARFIADAFEGPHGALINNFRWTWKEKMEAGENICCTIGAHQECIRFEYGKEFVDVMRRKGFIKYCLQYGYRIQPIYCFGESKTHVTLDCKWYMRFRLMIGDIGWTAPPFFFGSWLFCPLPLMNVELLTFVGPPLELPHIKQPTQAEIDEWHMKYVEALVALFDKHKAEAGIPDAKLEVY